MASHPTHDNEMLMIDDRVPAPYNPGPARVELATVRDAELLRTAVELRAADLGGLAKKNATEGYGAAARTQRGDALVLLQRIAPQLAQQITMHSDRMPKPIAERAAAAFRSTIERALRDAATSAEHDPSNVESRYEIGRALGAELAARVAEFAAELYEMAYHAGLSERQSTFESIADKAAMLLAL